MPTVSVLIPTYARPAMLERAIRSVLEQDFPHEMEVIVGDDGTVNDDVISKFGSRVRHLRNRPTLGLPANVDRLGRHASGEFLAYLMDDDYWLPRFLAEAIEPFDAMPDLGIVFANHFFERESRRSIRSCALSAGRHDEFAVELLRHNPVPISASVIRRELWSDISPMPETQAFDFVMWGRAAERGASFFYVDKPLMVYTSNPEGLSASRAFRREVVVALEALRFSDPEAQSLLRKKLMAARYSRLKGRLPGRRLLAALSTPRDA